MLAIATGKIMAGLTSLAMLGAVAALNTAGDMEHMPSLNETVTVTLDNGSKLSVARYEVTEREWRQCYEDGGCSFLPIAAKSPREKDYPVTGVNRFDVAEFIAWINSHTGRSYRLPTAAEWKELAPELSRTEKKKLFDDPRLAWAADYGSMPNVPARVQVAGHFGSAANGIADLKGNVWEWTASCVSANFNDADCPAYIAEGLHEAVLPIFIRDPASGGCAVGSPPANIGFRLVSDAETGVS